MDEWESLRAKIRDMEGQFLGVSGEVRATLEDVSVADFWKKRYEDEKVLWEEKLREKEKEQNRIKEKFLEDEQGIQQLNFKIRVLEQRLESEKQIWEERSKVKLVEAEMEKKKLEWETRIRELDQENGELRNKLRTRMDSSEEDAKRREKIEAEKAKLNEEIKAMQQKLHAQQLEEQRRMNEIDQERKTIRKQLDEMEAARKKSQEKSASVEKELSLMMEERDRHLALMAQREKEQFQAFEALARGFAHRVRNHLGIMAGTLQLAFNQPKLDEELKKQLTVAEQNAQETLKTIEEFLALAKIPDLALSPTNANDVVGAAANSLEDLARTKNVKIEKMLGATVPASPMDGRLVNEAVRQVLANAIEAAPQGSPVTVATDFDAMNRKVIIRVTDMGKGITEANLKKIFQAYFTTKKGKRGLGLCIAKHAVDLHHGALLISSAKDGGTAVTIQLPAVK